MDRIPPFGHGDDAGNGDSIKGEVGRRRRGHQERPAKADTGGNFAMKDQFCGANGESEISQVKEPLNRAGPRLGLPKGLDKSAETTHHQGFGIGEVKDADENKKEIRRHGGFYAGQVHFEYGSNESNSQEAPKPEQIIRMPAKNSVRQERQPANELGENEGDCRNPKGFQVKPHTGPIGFSFRNFHSNSRSQ